MFCARVAVTLHMAKTGSLVQDCEDGLLAATLKALIFMLDKALYSMCGVGMALGQVYVTLH